MKVLVVSSPGARLMVRRGTVYAVSPSGDKVAVTPDTELVIVATGASSISGRALRRLAEMGVRLLVLGQRGQVAAELRPVDRVNRTIESRMAQYRAKLEGWAIRYAAEMARAKIENQARLLRYIGKSRREKWLVDESYRVEDYSYRILESLEKNTASNDHIRGLEASAARRYWTIMASLLPGDYGFNGRNPFSDDPVNKALNYSYAILYGVAHDALVVAGLDPYAGFLHADRSGKESLVYDYSDPYKPIAVDKIVVAQGKPEYYDTVHGSLSYTARRELARAVSENLNKPYTDATGKRRSLRDHIYAYAWSLASSLRNQADYRAFRARL